MKTTTVARGFIGAVASLLGVVAVGCSAGGWDEGAAGNGEIGSVEQAITRLDVDSTGTPSLAAGLAYHSSCKVTVSGVDYLMVAGGQLSSGPTYSRDAFVLNTSTGTWHQFTNKLPAGVARGAMIRNPASGDSCVYFGGENLGGAVGSVTKLTLTVNGSGVPTGVTAANSADNITARSRFKAIECGSSDVLIVGGDDGGALSSLQVWRSASNTIDDFEDADGDVVTLTTARSEFALAKASTNRIAVFGGNGPSGRLSSVEAIIVDNDCKLVQDIADPGPYNTPVVTSAALSAAKKGLESFYFSNVSANVDRFAVVAGEIASGSAAVNHHDQVEIDWSALGSSARTNPTTMSTATKYPALAFVSTGVAFLVGGVAENDVQEYNAGWTTTNQDDATPANTLVAREGATADLVNGSIYAVGGFDGTNFLSSTLLIVP